MARLGNSLLKGHKDKSWRAYEAMLAASRQPTVLQLVPSSPHYPASSRPGQLPTQDRSYYLMPSNHNPTNATTILPNQLFTTSRDLSVRTLIGPSGCPRGTINIRYILVSFSSSDDQSIGDGIMIDIHHTVIACHDMMMLLMA